MSVEQQEHWITGEEFGIERRRLISEGVLIDDPRFEALHQRVHERDNYLYERYGKRYRETHEGKWIAISLGGEVIICDTLGELVHEATDRFGPANAALRKLADFPGLEWIGP